MSCDPRGLKERLFGQSLSYLGKASTSFGLMNHRSRIVDYEKRKEKANMGFREVGEWESDNDENAGSRLPEAPS